jgi:outer membrane protein TolC
MGLELAEKAILLNYGNFLPSITYLYSMGESRTEYPSYGSYNSDLTNWRSMLVASWSLFDGFETINQIKGSRAELNAARAQKQIISDGIALEVNSAYLNLLSAYDRIGAARYAADLAKRTLQIAEISYRSNILSEQNYLDAHAANQATQLGLISARFDFEVAKARLNKAVGKTII